MSSKSHIICNSTVEIFEETNEPITSFGKFMGFNVHLIANFSGIINVKANDNNLYLECNIEGLPKKLQFYLGDVIEFGFEYDEFFIVFEGGSLTQRLLVAKDFNKFLPKTK